MNFDQLPSLYELAQQKSKTKSEFSHCSKIYYRWLVWQQVHSKP